MLGVAKLLRVLLLISSVSKRLTRHRRVQHTPIEAVDVLLKMYQNKKPVMHKLG